MHPLRSLDRIARALGTFAAAALFAIPSFAPGDDAPEADSGDPKLGFELLLNKPYTIPTMTLEELRDLWTVWEPEARARAEAAEPGERRRMVFERYGFIERDFDSTGLPLGYTPDGKGNLVTNCLSCHGGKVAGRTVPGAANTHQDMAGMTADLREMRRRAKAAAGGKVLPPPPDPEISINLARGVSNAFVFSAYLTAMRDKEMNLVFPRKLGTPVDHDEDAPAWWTYKRKKRIYWTGFAPSNARLLMQFVMTPNNSGPELRACEPDFSSIQAYIKSLEPPKYPGPVDAALAAKGREAFEQSCARCHGTYGPGGKFPDKIVPLAEIGTDPVRAQALPAEWKEFMNASWMTGYGEHPFDVEEKGYIAPPLDGIWASAPYFHNGSVPTLFHVFNPEARPKVWRRDENGYDHARMGLEVEEIEAVSEGLSSRERRMFYDTALPGHGAGGHLFPDQELDAEEKIAVLEYLKTL